MESGYKTSTLSQERSDRSCDSGRAVIDAFFSFSSHFSSFFGHTLEFTFGTSLSALQIGRGYTCRMHIYPPPYHDSFLPNAPN